MRRKIIEQGYNTMTVSLPKEWCTSHGLKGGDEIEVSEKGNFLIVSKEAFKGFGNAKVDITGLDGSTIMLLIQGLYTYGYESLTITSRDSKAKHYLSNREHPLYTVIQNAANRLIGAEITRASSGIFEIQIVTEDSRQKFDVVLKRIFWLLIEQFDAFMERYRKNDASMAEQIDLKHIQIKRFINYAKRMLNKFGHEDAGKTTFYFTTIALLSKIDEMLRNLSDPKLANISKKACGMLEEVAAAFKDYHDLFYKYDLKAVSRLHVRRDLFKNRAVPSNLSGKDDLFLIGAFVQLNDLLLDLVGLKMAIEHKE